MSADQLAEGELNPQLPPGDISVLSTLSQSFAFHSSPESFISSRAHSVSSQQPSHEQEDRNTSIPQIVRARILNRNVAVISSYQICIDVLKAGNGLPQNSFKAAIPGETISSSTFTANAAYKQLMSDFFPPPNILLLDPPDHAAARSLWDEQLSSLPADSAPTIRAIAQDHFTTTWHDNSTIDLYENLKDLSWRLLLSTFLSLTPSSSQTYNALTTHHELLLRGQFSLFPVSITTPLYRTSRSKGLEARKKLQSLLTNHISTMSPSCPFLKPQKVPPHDMASNALLFTSSISVKALASLLTASVLNLFLFPGNDDARSLADRIRAEPEPELRKRLLDSVLCETERLSPPVVGVMRRVHQDLIFRSPNTQKRQGQPQQQEQQQPPPVLVPKGWDVWLYFVGAGRDSAVWPMADEFVPERFVAGAEVEGTKLGLAFGGGEKACLGREVVREMVRGVANVLLGDGLEDGDRDAGRVRLDGKVEAEGVRGWLGWQGGVSPQAFARDLKQLPCQRPKESIKVMVIRNRG